MIDRAALEATLGFRVVDIAKYESVFTHKSAIRLTGRACYERLEFIGDAVLSFVVAKYLFDRFPDEQEGFLTRIRTKLVSGEMLATLARRLGLDRFIVMNEKAMLAGWQTNKRIMEDVFESLLGAIYLDLGLMTAKTFVLAVMERHVDWRDLLRDTNFKDIAMRYAQARGLPLPEYRVLNDPQITRRPLFDVAVTIEGAHGRGAAATKKSAEQQAALQVLTQLKVQLD